MEPPDAFAWQWLLRNTTSGMIAVPGKAWIKEGQKRLSKIGEEEFQRRLDQWFQFPPEKTTLSPAGSSMIRLLVWYGSMVDVKRSLPTLLRLARVPWSDRDPARKVISALAWMLRIHAGSQFEADIKAICQDWADESMEVSRLEEQYRPDQAFLRKQARDAAQEKLKSEQDARLSALASSFPSFPKVSQVSGGPGMAEVLKDAFKASQVGKIAQELIAVANKSDERGEE